ncbi:MAG: hypothetical protein M1821_006301 [Bathelium mastoideum]|nr:MAG: hypothetical protein M1821_006301 [Bathelium mastoideum]
MLELSTWITVLLAGSVQAFRNPLPPSGGLTRREVVSINASDYPPLEINIPIDHYNSSDNRTYANRYWVNSKYYSPGGPIFYFDSGEQNAQPLVPYFLYEAAGPSSVMTLARRFNGLALIFEHRFYGQSFPFPINTTTGMAGGGYSAYKYLNTEQALQDPVYLANNFQPAGFEPYWESLSPQNTPWVWLGGSYPGIRGAQIRIRNPETFFASWASSAPTQAAVDMWTYYAQAERSMTKNCSADYTAVTRFVDATLSNGTRQEINDLKYDLYRAVQASPGNEQPNVNRSEAESLSNSDVGNYLLLPLSFYQYYGFEASVQPFCNVMETFNQSNASTTDNGGTAKAIASESGIASTYNISLAWQSFLTGIAQINYDIIPYQDDPVQDISWQFQYCSEYGYFQRGNPENPHTIESEFISLSLFQSQCDETFPEGLPPSPNVTASNKYGGWYINPSNVMFSSGEFDPWRALSPTSIEIGSPGRQAVQDIPDCGVAPANDTVFGPVYRDMVHVSDMRALLNKSDPNHQNFSTVGFASPIDTEPFYAGVGLFQMALEKWLPCFGNGSYASMTFQFPDS